MDQNPQPGTADTSSNVDKVREQFSQAVASADTRAAERIQHVALVQQARGSQLARTAASLLARYGPKDSQVKAAQAAVATTRATAARVSIVGQQAATPTPQVANEGWVLHGRVFEDPSRPLSGYTVFLVDGEKLWQQTYGFSYTDNTGYFLINFPGDPAQAPTPTPPQTKSQTKAAQAQAADAARAPELFLAIVDAKAQPVYVGTTAFTPAPGSLTYQNITLPSGDQPIGDPPPAIRGVATPPEGKP